MFIETYVQAVNKKNQKTIETMSNSWGDRAKLGPVFYKDLAV